MMKVLGLAAGAMMLATAANAEPVTLTDANMDGVTAAGYYGYGYYKHYYYTPNTAYAEADAYALALGAKTDASTYAYTFAITTPVSSEAGAYSSSSATTY